MTLHWSFRDLSADPGTSLHELGGLGDRRVAVILAPAAAPPEGPARGVGDGLVPGAWIVDGPAAGERLVGVEDRPGSAADLLRQRHLVTVDLR